MSRAALAVCLAVLAVLVAPLAFADPVVDAQVTAVKNDDGTLTASFHVINTGPDAVALDPVVPADPRCLPAADPTSVGGSQSSTVEVVIPASCFADDSTPIALDLDGVGEGHPLPASRVMPPQDEASDWSPLWWGAWSGAGLALIVGLWGRAALKGVASPRTTTSEETETAEASYTTLKGIVDARVALLGGERLTWVDAAQLADVPPRQPYTWRSTVANLEAGWSFKDSWVSNLSVATTAFVTLASSADLFTAVLGEEPQAALGVMTVGGLVAVVVIGLANTLVKLVGPSTSVVTVAGLTLSSALVVFAAGLQSVTVGLAAAIAVGGSPVAVGAVVLTAAVCAGLVVYGGRTLGEAIRGGVPVLSSPGIPADALEAWAGAEDWEKALVLARIKQEYSPWLTQSSQPAVNETPTRGLARELWARPTASLL